MSRSRTDQASEIIARRLARLRAAMAKKGAEAYLVTNRRDQYYLTHFDGEDGAVLVLANHVYLITDGRFKEEAQIRAPWARAIVRRNKLSDAIGKLARKHRIEKMLFDPAETSVSLASTLKKACRPTRLVAAADLLTDMRHIKDSSEVEAIIRAAEVAEAAFLKISRLIRPGMTERQIAADLLHEMLRLGASDASFPIIVAEGAASSLPHARAGDRKIRIGSAVLIDWGATVDHYRSDLTRVLFVRKIPPKFRRMYENVLAAQAVGIDAIRPGVALADVDRKARHVLKRCGMDKAFSHSLGHGIGLDIHEAPRLAKKAKGTLQAGMVVTVEPGVYFPGVGGVRIEDDVLVTESGYRLLTHLPKELDSMVV